MRSYLHVPSLLALIACAFFLTSLEGAPGGAKDRPQVFVDGATKIELRFAGVDGDLEGASFCFILYLDAQIDRCLGFRCSPLARGDLPNSAEVRTATLYRTNAAGSLVPQSMPHISVRFDDSIFVSCPNVHSEPVLTLYMPASVTDLRDSLEEDMEGVFVVGIGVLEFGAEAKSVGEIMTEPFTLIRTEKGVRAFFGRGERRSAVTPRFDLDGKVEKKKAEPGATDNPDGAQRLREDH